MSAPSGWDGILAEGETILWQGQPDGRFAFGLAQVFTTLFGLAFAAFALFWMVLASSAGGLFWAFGLIHFSAGLGMVIVPVFWPPIRRRRTWYTLTDRRAFIATNLPFAGRRLRDYPIHEGTSLDHQKGWRDDGLSTVIFHRTPARHRPTNRAGAAQGRVHSQGADIGFERIKDGDKVAALIRQIIERDRARQTT